MKNIKSPCNELNMRTKVFDNQHLSYEENWEDRYDTDMDYETEDYDYEGPMGKD